MRNSQRIITSLSIGLTLCATSTLAVPTTIFTTTLGSNNDGLGGFQQSADNFYGGYTTNSENVQWFQQANDSLNGGPGGDTNGALNNNSLLQEFSLNRSVGNAYTITGTMTWSSEADRNNRQGLYLFGDANDIAAIAGEEDATGDLSLQYQADLGVLRLQEGLDTTTLNSAAPAEDAPATDSYFSNISLIFQADIRFVNNGGTDQIEIDFTLFNDFDGDSVLESDTISATVDANDYTGNYFGFAGRTRDDGDGNVIAQYESFSIVQTAVPEPSSLALLGLGGLCILRRRRD